MHIGTIEAEVVFLSHADGGRVQPPNVSLGSYMPHLVVQPPDVRDPVIVDANRIEEDYLGVCFVAGPAKCLAGEPVRVTMALMYYPRIRYDGLREGATFTIREGARIVGFGRVQRGVTTEHE
jgi:hypothetical protein